VNTLLSGDAAYSGPEEACKDLFTLKTGDINLPWPRCVGLVRVSKSAIFKAVHIATTTTRTEWHSLSSLKESEEIACHGILFEHVDGLMALERGMVTPDVSHDILHALEKMHKLRALHGNLQDLDAYADVRCRNIYIKNSRNSAEKSKGIQFFILL
jgi:hypothetical protein